MHILFATRGIKQDVDNFIRDLQGHFYTLERKDKDGKIEKGWVQGALRPLQLWEYVIPDCGDNVDRAINTIFQHEKNPVHTKLDKILKYFRKLIGAKEVPPNNPKAKKFLTAPTDNIDIMRIGIKPDDTGWFDAGFYQERI